MRRRRDVWVLFCGEYDERGVQPIWSRRADVVLALREAKRGREAR